MSHSISYPPLSSLKHLEGTGNFAVRKYYDFPFRYFYRHKFKMMVDLIGDDCFYEVLDFGSGSGIFRTELSRHSHLVHCVDTDSKIDTSRRYDAIFCASVLEFTHLYSTVSLLYSLLSSGGILYVASPMDTRFSQLYFKAIKDTKLRHSHGLITNVIESKFKIKEYKEWIGLYFALKAVKN